MDPTMYQEFGRIFMIGGAIVAVFVLIMIVVKIYRTIEYNKRTKELHLKRMYEKQKQNSVATDSKQDEGILDIEDISSEVAKESEKEKRQEETTALSHDEFVAYCSKLIENNAFTDVEVNDKSDLTAYKGSISYYFRCYVATDAISEDLFKEIAALKVQFDKKVGIVLAYKKISPAESELAENHGILIWDKDFINSMAEEYDEDDSID